MAGSNRGRSSTLVFLLALVKYIDSNPGSSSSELAAHFGVSEKRINQAVETLSRSGHRQLETDQIFDFDWSVLEDHGTFTVTQVLVEGPPRLTVEETQSILVGFDLIADSLVASGIDAADLMSRLLAISADPQSLPPRDSLQLIPAAPTAEIWATVREAIRTNQQVNIAYMSGTGDFTQRNIDPVQLSRSETTWIVRAWCHQAQAVRHFRLDRISSAVILEFAQNHPQLPTEPTNTETCVVTLTPEGGWLAADLPGKSSSTADGSFQVVFDVLSRAWMISQLLSVSPYVECVEPKNFFLSAGSHARKALETWRTFSLDSDA